MNKIMHIDAEKANKPLTFMGFAVVAAANQSAISSIGRADSKPTLVIPADEEK